MWESSSANLGNDHDARTEGARPYFYRGVTAPTGAANQYISGGPSLERKSDLRKVVNCTEPLLTPGCSQHAYDREGVPQHWASLQSSPASGPSTRTEFFNLQAGNVTPSAVAGGRRAF